MTAPQQLTFFHPTRWHYLATKRNPALAGSRVTVVATDNPGNTDTQTRAL